MTETEIQEMARTICGLNADKGCFCDGGYCNYNCLAYEKAKALYSKGYRKASEVARKIFGELEATFYGDGFHYFIAMPVFDILKKKYTEEQNNERE